MSTQLIELLRQTLVPSEAKQGMVDKKCILSKESDDTAEKGLSSVESNPGFISSLLQVICDTKNEMPIRQAGALFFKNFIKRNWSIEDAGTIIAETDRNVIKGGVVQAMTTLPSALQLQLGEAITIIANTDFPSSWPNLVDDLISNMSASDMTITNGVLQTAHSIFKRWRAQYRSDELFTEIAFVLHRFCEPFLALFKQIDSLIDQNTGNTQVLNTLFETMVLLTKVFYDLNSQDIPEFFEDHMTEFMTILHKYLIYHN